MDALLRIKEDNLKEDTSSTVTASRIKLKTPVKMVPVQYRNHLLEGEISLGVCWIQLFHHFRHTNSI